MRLVPTEMSTGPIKRLTRRHIVGLAVAALAVICGTPVVCARADQAVVLEIDGVIGPAIADYVARGLSGIDPTHARLVILRMNTPGGLDTSMRDIIRAILASPVPVAAYVAPSGARAASAGTYIVYASAIAAMAPGTNLGAATPIQLGGLPGLPGGTPETSKSKDQDKDRGDSAPNEAADAETRKVVNDAVAYIRGLAELNRRNSDWAADAVRHAVSAPASEALKLHVIDVVAEDVADLLRKVDGRTVIVGGEARRLAVAGLEVVTIRPDWRTEILATLTNPNVAFILMLIGVYGLIFEFLSPGAVAPGLIGAISLLVALFALNLLPINYAGAGLLLLGIGLMVAEAHIGSFGIIGVGGIVAFAIGATMMFPSTASGFGLSSAVVIVATLLAAAFFILALSMLMRSRHRPVITGKEALLGAAGEVVSWQGQEGRVLANGEIWRARASAPLQPGMHVKIIDCDRLVLVVEPS